METTRNEMGSEENVVRSVKPKTGVELRGNDIPEWFLIALLVRLPVKLVFRFKLVSKQWLSLISDPYFIQTYISRASMSQKSQPWTLISNNMLVNTSRTWGVRVKDLFMGGSGDRLVRTHFKQPGYCTISCPSINHRYGKRYGVIGVSNGLVLYGSHLRREWCLRDFHQYSICNPVTGQVIALPLHVEQFTSVSTGFLTRVEDSILTSYRVVRLGLPLRSAEVVRFNVFSSEIGEWKEFIVHIDKAIEVEWYRLPIVFNGFLHWVTYRHGMIAYDPYGNPDQLRFIALPAGINLECNDNFYKGIPSLCDVHEGRLKYFESSVREFSVFCVWLLNDYNNGDWSLLHTVNFDDILCDDAKLYGEVLLASDLPVPIMFHPFNSDIVFLGYQDKFVSYNMKTKKLDDHDGFLDIGDIVGKTKFVVDKDWPCWWSTFVLVIPSWPIYIPPPSFVVADE